MRKSVKIMHHSYNPMKSFIEVIIMDEYLEGVNHPASFIDDTSLWKLLSL